MALKKSSRRSRINHATLFESGLDDESNSPQPLQQLFIQKCFICSRDVSVLHHRSTESFDPHACEPRGLWRVLAEGLINLNQRWPSFRFMQSFWSADEYKPGRSQPSFDKQFMRDCIETLDWDKQAPPSPIPYEIAAATTSHYLAACRLLTGKEL